MEKKRLSSNKGTIIEESDRYYGYQWSWLRFICFVVFCILTCGILLILSLWNDERRIKLTHRRCPIQDASIVIVIDDEKQAFVSKVEQQLPCSDCRNSTGKSPKRNEYALVNCSGDQSGNRLTATQMAPDCKHFTHKLLRYFIVNNRVVKSPIHDPVSLAKQDHVDDVNGLTAESYDDLVRLHGENSIRIPKKSYARVFIDLAANPFYVFQVCTVIIWSIEEYYIFSGFIVAASLFCLVLTTIVTKREQDRLRGMVAGGIKLEVWRRESDDDSGEAIMVDSHDLVPGDLITVNEDIVFPCDAILVNGTCVVNESMLTGESVPVLKVAQRMDEIRREKEQGTGHKQQTLFNGTRVLQAQSSPSKPVLAVVMRTGFSTTKGGLIRSLVLPKRIDFHFYGDFFKFILCLTLPATAGSIYTFYSFLQLGVPLGHVILRAISLITLMIPPDLPIILAASLLIAARHLTKLKIGCIELPRISLAGRISCFCFDKTGTLTYSDLVLEGVMGVRKDSGTFLPMATDGLSLKSNMIKAGMACCHSLVYINGKLEGDSLEKEMFQFVDGTLAEDTESDGERTVSMACNDDAKLQRWTVVKIFPFESSIGRMSCIARTDASKKAHVFCKGAPEVVARRCKTVTLPSNYDAILHDLAAEGCRVLAVAGKELPPDNNSEETARCNVEENLDFYGLLVFQNMCKPETRPSILELSRANIRTLMVTGDHLLTGLHIAKQCGMINKGAVVYKAEHVKTDIVIYKCMDGSAHDQIISTAENLPVDCHLLMTGETFQIIHDKYPDSYDHVLLRGTVFARMSPDLKATLMRGLKALDHCVAMCGDGANDCGALKTADVGIALSETEASVASPVTSQVENISCCPALIKDGRTALVTTTMLFTIVMLGAFVLTSVAVVLSTVGPGVSDFAQIYAYFFQFIPLVLTMMIASPNPVLSRKKPRFALFRLDLICTMLCIICALFGCFLVYFLLMQAQSWYLPPTSFNNAGQPYLFFSYEHVCAANFMLLQLPLITLVLYAGAPHRKPLYTNYPHLALVGASFTLNLMMVLFPWPHLLELFKFISIPTMKFRLYAVLLSVGSCVLSFLILRIGNESRIAKRMFNVIRRKKESKKKYKRMTKELTRDHDDQEPLQTSNLLV